MRKNTALRKAGITLLGTMALSAALVATPIENNVTASASSVHYEIKKSGYVYKNAHIKATKSHSAKNYFGSHKLTVKKTVVIKRHGKKLVYKYVVASNGRSGYVYAGTIKRVVVKHVKKVAKKKVHVNKKAVKKVVKKTAKKAVKKTTAKRVKAEPNKSQAQKNLNDLYAYLGNYNADSDNSGSQNNSSLSDAQIISQVKSQFISFVNQQRKANGKSAWVENAKLDAVAQKRVSYVDPDMGDASHYITSDGQQHSQLAATIDAQTMGYNMTNIMESNGDALGGSSLGGLSTDDVNQLVAHFEDMIVNDGWSNNGHRNQLLGISGQNGLQNFGIGVRVIRNSDGSTQVNLVILSSDTAY
ncbi:MAG: hypothetical protein M3Z82_06660 [Apilactobacillus sp.]|nr:hypothetical protein [Apilactobacillus sp.]